MIVYCFLNTKNNKIYVGATKRTLEERWRNHKLSAKQDSNHRFHAAIRKHGAENFEGFVLENCVTPEELIEAEQRWIKFLCSRNYDIGYNMTDGGTGTPGWFITEETRENMRKAQLGKKASEETKRKMRESHKNRPKISEETRQRLREANGGANNAMFGKCGEESPRFGKKHSEETRRKISEAQKRRLAKKKLEQLNNS